MNIQNPYIRATLSQSDGPIAVGASGNIVLATYDVRSFDRLSVEVLVADQNLDGFIIEVRTHGNGSYNVIANSATEFITPVGLIVGAESYDAANARLSGDLTTIVAGGRGLLVMDVSGLNSVRLSASAAANSASVTTLAGVH